MSSPKQLQNIEQSRAAASVFTLLSITYNLPTGYEQISY